jgi:menaquinone-dependent protoporphyrinogen oxidase
MENKVLETKVLVAYASTYGSTREVAQAVASALEDAGVAVDLRPMKEVKSLAEYGGVVLGAPLYMFHWHKDARAFTARHRDALSKLPVAVFALGPFNDKGDEWQEVRKELNSELAKFPWLAPAAVTVFGGRFDPDKLRFPYKLIPALRQIPASDIRDWTAIGAWAKSLPARLAPSHAQIGG